MNECQCGNVMSSDEAKLPLGGSRDKIYRSHCHVSTLELGGDGPMADGEDNAANGRARKSNSMIL